MFRFTNREIALLILFFVLNAMPIGAQLAEMSDAAKKAHDEVVALETQIPSVCNAQDKTGCDRLLEKLLVIGENYQLGADEEFRKAIILPLYMSPAAQKDPGSYAGRALKIFGHDMQADQITGPACSLAGRSAIMMGGKTGLNRIDQIEKQYPYCKDALASYRSILAQAVAAQEQDYSAVEGLDASKQAAAKKIATLGREAEKAFGQGREAEGQRLFQEILATAKRNELQEEHNFVAVCYKIPRLIAGDNVDKYIKAYSSRSSPYLVNTSPKSSLRSRATFSSRCRIEAPTLASGFFNAQTPGKAASHWLHGILWPLRRVRSSWLFSADRSRGALPALPPCRFCSEI